MLPERQTLSYEVGQVKLREGVFRSGALDQSDDLVRKSAKKKEQPPVGPAAPGAFSECRSPQFGRWSRSWISRGWMRSHILAAGPAGIERGLTCGVVGVRCTAAGLVLNLALFLTLAAFTLWTGGSFWRWIGRR